jgi:cytoskeletal protein CcmA (bactofilin family)
MFKSNHSTPMSKNPEINSPEKLNRIVDGTSIEGHIKSDSNIRIDGRLKGTIITKGKLVIGSTGSIEGEITCESADIEGAFVGKIVVNGLLTLKSTSKLTGDIMTGKLAIEPGAVFSGSCSMGGLTRESMPITENEKKTAVA